MRVFALALISVFFASCTVSVAQGQEDGERAAIKKLEFLVGHWAGKGTSFADDGTQSTYYDTEDVWFDVKNTLLIIQARGFRGNEQFYGLHTVIYYDIDAGHYWYNPYRANGARRFKCTLLGQIFSCLSPDEKFRLTFKRTETGEWNEYGERLKENGDWLKTFETILEPAQIPEERAVK